MASSKSSTVLVSVSPVTQLATSSTRASSMWGNRPGSTSFIGASNSVMWFSGVSDRIGDSSMVAASASPLLTACISARTLLGLLVFSSDPVAVTGAGKAAGAVTGTGTGTGTDTVVVTGAGTGAGVGRGAGILACIGAGIVAGADIETAAAVAGNLGA
eukprot:Gregarina_sp_Poly_1__3716@NODE_209_length_11372_cov_428_789120_g186_i0_p9_GENE_NODE_209_length_11372_cov_428_789120_g186_i0NODE_209_length_11372_cov_428_789120_g186_i0_p9_ORF_typecomplete_len158_score19_33KRTAP/PF11759_8/2_NODE_209_length_11372_cov_428_789120_g186_i076608133